MGTKADQAIRLSEILLSLCLRRNECLKEDGGKIKKANKSVERRNKGDSFLRAQMEESMKRRNEHGNRRRWCE